MKNNKEHLENMNLYEEKSGYFARRFFSGCLVIIMLLTSWIVGENGSGLLAKYANEQWLSDNGVLLEKEDIEDYLVDIAVQMLDGAQELLVGRDQVLVDEKVLADEYYNPNENGDELLVREIEPGGGVYGAVLTEENYFEKETKEKYIKAYEGGKKIDADSLESGTNISFWYEDGKAYIMYDSDDVLNSYNSLGGMDTLNKAVSRLETTLSDISTNEENDDNHDIRVAVTVDSEWLYERNHGNPYLDSHNFGGYEQLAMAIGGCITSFLLALVITTRSKRELKKKRRIVTEIPLIAGGAALLAACCGVIALFENPDYYNHWILRLFGVSCILFVYIFYRCVRELVLKLKEHSFLRDLFVVRLFRWIWKNIEKGKYKDFSIVKKIWIKKLTFLVVTLIVAGVVIVIDMAYAQYICPIILIIYFVGLYAYHFYEMKLLRGLNEVYQQVEEIYKGNYVVREMDENNILYDITDKLNELSCGMEEAVEKRISSEKMKIELVTNVSHDLKTPLTSIISYVNLLKEEEMSDVAQAYIKILEEKSYQLKNIVSDVFDLAKANSGQDVEIEKIDGIMLVNQVLADMQDNIMRSGKSIKTAIEPDTFFIEGDGKKLYRAIQNLIDNALKYSMEGTRIYLTTGVHQDKLILEIKNIASYEMEFTGENIVERFVRGDESRTTEGSGLGLSIAKSFIEVSGGKMDVIVDGDVFKVVIVF